MLQTALAQPRTASFCRQVDIVRSSAQWLMEGTKDLSTTIVFYICLGILGMLRLF